MLKIALLGFILAVSAYSGNITVQLTCEPCTVSCAYANCFKISSDGYNQQVCSSSSCSTSFSTTFLVSSCSIGNTGTSCSTNLCYQSTGSLRACIDEYDSYTNYVCTASSSYYMNVECGSCRSTSCSGKCFTYTGTYFNPSYELCVGLSSCYFSTMNIAISRCSGGVDWLGRTCSCCYAAQFTGLTTNMSSGVCTSTNPVLSASSFTTYAQNKTKDSPKFQKIHYVGAAILMLIITMIY